jgi:hypothetical protein
MNRKLIAGACAGLLSLFLIGCASSKQQQAELETQKKLAEMQKQLDEANKKIEAAQQPPAATPATPAPADAAKKSAPAGTKSAASDKNAQAIAANKSGIDKNAQGIAANKSAIDKNAQGIDQNRQAIQQVDAKAEEAKRMAAAPPSHTLDAGTAIPVRLNGKISTKTMNTGSTFEAALSEPLMAGNYVIADRGATVEGVVTNADPGGRVKGIATVQIALRGIIMADGRRLAIKTNTHGAEAKKSTGKDAMKVGIASGIGAAIGAIAGGGKGAAIGAGAGAAGGTGMVLATKGEAAEIPAETAITFKLAAPVTVQELKR